MVPDIQAPSPPESSRKHPRRLIVGAEEAVQNWRSRMSSLSNVDYDIDEVGATVIEAISDKGLASDRLSLFAQHFANHYYDDDRPVAQRAFLELAIDLERILERLQIRDQNGRLNFLFDRWLGDDLVLLEVPY